MSAKPEEKKEGEAAAAAAAPAAAAAGGGIKAWLPLIANLVLMPALAYATMTFVILPKLKPDTAHAEDAEAGGEAEKDSHGAAAKDKGHGESKPDAKAHGEPAKKEHGAAKSGAHGKSGGASKGKVTVPLSKNVLVNVAGTMGTRYLLVNVQLVGTKEELRTKVEDHDAELRDAAANALSAKTIADLERPGSRNMIRAELIGIFNEILGDKSVVEIYFPDFAIQ